MDQLEVSLQGARDFVSKHEGIDTVRSVDVMVQYPYGEINESYFFFMLHDTVDPDCNNALHKCSTHSQRIGTYTIRGTDKHLNDIIGIIKENVPTGGEIRGDVFPHDLCPTSNTTLPKQPPRVITV